jgi:hypothetical protein
MDDENLQLVPLDFPHSAPLTVDDEHFSFRKLIDLPLPPSSLNVDDQNLQYRDTAPKRHKTGANAYGWIPNSIFSDKYPSRKVATQDVRKNTGLAWKQSSTSKSSSSVITDAVPTLVVMPAFVYAAQINKTS